MRSSEDIFSTDAFSQSIALSSQQLRSEQLVAATLNAISTNHLNLNCFIHIDIDGALAAARASDIRRDNDKQLSPIDGLTIAVKDNIDVAGMPTTAGLGMDLHTATKDATVVAALRAAGAIIIGKLNMDEAAVGTSNNNPHHGQCRNPKYPNLVPGGSSGGSSSAVAAGLCSMALGTDTMGSIRIPAACCGIVGMKPSANTLSNNGIVPCSIQLDTVGPLCRSIRDLNLWLPILRGDKNVPLKNIETLKPLKDLKIAVANNLEVLLPITQATSNAYQRCIKKISDEGQNVFSISVEEIDFSLNRLAGLITVEAGLSSYFDDLKPLHNEAFSQPLKKMLSWFKKQESTIVEKAKKDIEQTAKNILRLMGNADILLLPTLADKIPSCDEPAPVGLSDLTALANMAGLPAISFPIIQDKINGPISMQLIGRHDDDLELIEIADQVMNIINKTKD